ncbi:MAG: cytochrome c biogenesis protein CcsA, partial [Planctomycetes bacterium]|nr:cytochrome c biogenesis protein CcsA [Planctomycetota bacterium]
LLDVRKDDYAGTTMPRNYSSQVRLTDPTRNVEFETKIWMNNPLRYAGETFYQSGYRAGRRGEEFSTLQIVKNTGWMIPYVSCMIVATGMLAHFLLLLFRFLRQVQQRDSTEETGETTDAAVALPPSPAVQFPVLLRCLVPLAVVLLGAAYIASMAIPARPPDSLMRLDQFGSLPLTYQGRVKPFDTLARNSLRVISNRETFVDARNRRQPAIRWLLDVIARPERAKDHRVFRIDNLEVLKSLGLQRRRGFRYAWTELEANAAKLERQVMDAQKQPPEQRTPQQRRILELRQRIDRYRLLSDSFRPLQLPRFPSKEAVESKDEEAMKTVEDITRRVKGIPATSRTLAARQPPLAAPVGPPEQPWRAYAAAENESYLAQHLMKKERNPALTKLASIFEAYQENEVTAFNQAVSDYKTFLADKPPSGLDLRMTDFEAYFNHLAPFYRAIPLYVLALVLTALGWLAAIAWPRLSALMHSSTFWLIVLVFALHTFALAARVAISGRPPVTNLYSSAVFVGWGCVALGLLLESLFRLGIGNSGAAVAGIGTLIIAHFLAADGDTIRVLQAVLDTQFWLTVHVLTVTLGYSATFLAGLLGLVLAGFAFGKAVVSFVVDYLAKRSGRGRLPGDWLSEVERILGAMIFGTVCFAAFFSLVGTVLGGLWADDSWGRFWGWDPKENGALMVVLWNVLVLHARWARMVKERGLALLAIGGNIVTAWSWFGVNELGVGLHSYGFTEGAARALWLFWISQLVVIGLGVLALFVSSTFSRRPGPMEASST